MTRLLSSLAAILLATAPSPAASPPMIEVRGVFLYATGGQMKAALAAADLAQPPGRPITPAQFETIRAKLKADGADIFSEPQTITNNGQRAVVSSVRELRYPTEFTVSRDRPGKWTPTGFEARNVGVELEFEAMAREADGEIDLSVIPTVTTFLGFIDYGSAKESRAEARPIESLLKAPLNEGGCWQPVFLQFKVVTSLKLKGGNYALMGGTMKAERIPSMGGLPEPPAPKDEPEIFVFLTAKTVSPE